MRTSILLITSIMHVAAPVVSCTAEEARVAEVSQRSIPRISVGEALEIAEKKYQTLTESARVRFVESARYLEYNEATPEMGPRWIITYALLRYGRGGQIFVSVYMDGTTSIFRGR
jgi:hypothetical protein